MDYGQMKVLVREGGTANETPYKLLKSFSSWKFYRFSIKCSESPINFYKIELEI
jgi:hypothetical protein